MVTRTNRAIWLTLLPILSFGVSSAQISQGVAPAKEKPPLVTVPFFAADNHGNPIPITYNDLSVVDDKMPASIVAVRSAAELPLRLGVLIDTSSSEARSSLHEPAAQSASDFLSKVLKKPEDGVFLITFATTVDGTAFMNKDEFPRFNIDLHAGGGTSLFDAIYFASRERMQVDHVQPARHVLVILSDGGDNQSRVNHEEAIAAAQKAGVVIFAVSTSENDVEILTAED